MADDLDENVQVTEMCKTVCRTDDCVPNILPMDAKVASEVTLFFFPAPWQGVALMIKAPFFLLFPATTQFTNSS